MDSVDHGLDDLNADDKGIVMWHDCVNPYDLMGWFLGGVSIFNPLDGLLCNEFRAVTFSHEFFKVCFPSEAVVHSVSMRPMEGTVFASIPLVRISLQEWRSSYPSRLIFLLCRLLCGNSIVIPECIAFRSRVDLCQSLAGSDSQLTIQVVFS
ncbi:unnamed protein product [Prunus brigantina]